MKHVIKFFLVILLYSALLLVFSSCSSRQTVTPESNVDLSFYGELYFINNKNGSMWTINKSDKYQSVESAKQYLEKLNDGEYQDWRFPTKQELYDLFEIFDFKKNGEVKISIEGAYWLMIADGSLNVGAWEIGSGCGPERTFYLLKQGAVMAVRP